MIHVFAWFDVHGSDNWSHLRVMGAGGIHGQGADQRLGAMAWQSQREAHTRAMNGMEVLIQLN